MEEESPLTRWLGNEGTWLLAGLEDGAAAEDLRERLHAGEPYSNFDWQQLILSCMQYGSVAHLAAVLDRTPAEAFDDFPLSFGMPIEIDDECFDLFYDRVWAPHMAEHGTLDIREATLSASVVRRIAEIVRNSIALRDLTLVQCTLHADDACALWAALLETKCPIEHLMLTDCTTSGALARAAEISPSPEPLGHLTQLTLASVQLSAEDAVALARLLGSFKSLKDLNLSGNALGDEAGSVVLRAAVDHTKLATLMLEHGALGAGFAATLVGVGGDTGSLQTLELGGNDFSGMPAGLGAAITRNRGLRNLSLYATRLTSKCANDLLVGIAGSRCALKVLDLSRNGLVDLDLRVLAENTRIEKVFLHGNELSAAAYQSAGDMLHVQTSLKWLVIDMESGNLQAMKHLAAGLSRNQSLTRLRLIGTTSLTEMQMTSLVGALKGNASLSVLYVPHKLVEDGPIQWLFEHALENNVALADVAGLNFAWSPMGFGPAKITNALTRNRRASNEDLVAALHKLVKQCVVLGAGLLPDELACEIAWLVMGRRQVRSVAELRNLLAMRVINKAIAFDPKHSKF